MTIDPAWEEAHKSRQWGTCPETQLGLFVRRRFSETLLKRALDLGCGIGAQARWLAREGFQVNAIDASDTAIVRLGRLLEGETARLPYRGPIETRVGDVCALPYHVDIFDLVVDVCTLQHVDDIGQALCEAVRVLKPGGWLFSMAAGPEHADAPNTPPFRRLDLQGVHHIYGAGKWWSEMRVGRQIVQRDMFLGISLDDASSRIPLGIPVTDHWIIEAQKALQGAAMTELAGHKP